MKLYVKDIILENIVKNLLHAQNIAADKGDFEGVIKLSKYLIKLTDKLGKKMVNIGTMESKQDAETPPYKS